MSDTSWEDFNTDPAAASDAGTLAATIEGDTAPVIDAADNDSWQADNATSWGDWNAATAGQATDYAQREIAYANEQYASGDTEGGDAAIARADNSIDVAADHAGIAADQYDTAASYSDSAADGYGTAADYAAEDAAAANANANADSGSYDSGGYNSGSDDASATSYDAGAADSSSYDTSSYDAGSSDEG